MQFSTVFTALLASIALTSGVLASPIDSVEIEARAAKPGLDSIKGSKDAYNKIKKYCASNKKRDLLEARGPSISVGMGKSDFYNDIPIGLDTSGLVTCMGIVVTGNQKQDNKKTARGLAHFVAAEHTMDMQWTEFADKITKAELEGMKAYLSVPDTSVANDLWDDDLKDLTNKIETQLTNLLQELTGSSPTMHKRPLTPASNMAVDAEQNVTY